MSGQERILNFELKGIQYDSLFIYAENMHKNKIRITGSLHNGIWHFSIPDSVRQYTPEFELRQKSFDYQKYIKYIIQWYYVVGSDTLVTSALNFEEAPTTIHAKFLNTIRYNNLYFLINLKGKDKSVFGSCMADRFQLLDPIPSDARIRLRHPFYSYFFEDATYDAKLKMYEALAVQNPNSKYLIINLARNLDQYRSRKDVSSIFDHFTDANKQSTWGMIVQKYLIESHFGNILLPNSKNNKLEPIIQDSTKYNLIVFSASWCKPCHKLIPLLKQIYADLHNQLSMTYISLDEKETIDNWRNLMEKQQIPWRSLLAFNDLNGVKARYYVKGIPTSILVYPDGRMEVIEVKDKMDMERLYRIVQVKAALK
jgi:thiol-disulfide isomerase/thioredoxin